MKSTLELLNCLINFLYNKRVEHYHRRTRFWFDFPEASSTNKREIALTVISLLCIQAAGLVGHHALACMESRLRRVWH